MTSSASAEQPADYAPLRRVRQRNNAPQLGVPLDAKQAAQLKRFGANVRRERMRRCLTQEGSAEAVELNPRTVQKIEAWSVNILLTTVLRIQRGLRCSWEKPLERP